MTSPVDVLLEEVFSPLIFGSHQDPAFREVCGISVTKTYLPVVLTKAVLGVAAMVLRGEVTHRYARFVCFEVAVDSGFSISEAAAFIDPLLPPCSMEPTRS